MTTNGSKRPYQYNILTYIYELHGLCKNSRFNSTAPVVTCSNRRQSGLSAPNSEVQEDLHEK